MRATLAALCLLAPACTSAPPDVAPDASDASDVPVSADASDVPPASDATDAPRVGPQGCRSQTECGLYPCLAPDPGIPAQVIFGPAPCSDYSNQSCTDDSGCTHPLPGGGTAICMPSNCGMVCVSGCAADRDCAAQDTVCGASHRCVYRTCTTPSDCGASFDCTAGTCARRACTGDAGCAGGACVDGLCYDGPGHCGGPDT